MDVEIERQVMEDVIRTLDRRENENLPQVQLTKTEVHCSLLAPLFNHGRISSVVRAHYCSAGGRGFDSRDPTSTQGLKITEKSRYSLCTTSV